jgi:hypothetical protein
MFVFCVVRKGKMMDSQNKDTSADEVQTTKECEKRNPVGRDFPHPPRPAPGSTQRPIE